MIHYSDALAQTSTDTCDMPQEQALKILATSPDSNAHDSSWQASLQQVIRKPSELLEILQLSPKQVDLDPSQLNFPLRVPREYVAKMMPGEASDPLLLQILPSQQEQENHPGYLDDPVGDLAKNPIPGLIHKYTSRVLLIINGSCAIHCRYCFRRHFPYDEHKPSKVRWQQALDYISSHPEINEVILSGGDPLTLSDSQLAWLTRAIDAIPHVSRLRIHSRTIAMISQRVCPALLEWITSLSIKVILVNHINHANEIDTAFDKAMYCLQRAGVTLLNQAVLLKGINDTVEAQIALSERLFSAGVLPYYLNLLDKVQGAAHFDTPEAHASQLMQKLRCELPGFLVPQLVREVAGEPYKVPIT